MYKVLIQTEEQTVMSEFIPSPRTNTAYQSEAQLEHDFIEILKQQGYEYCTIHNEPELVDNLRYQIERLNGLKFSDSDWPRFFTDVIANKKDGIVEKAHRIQDGDSAQEFQFSDGSNHNIRLIDKEDIHNNHLQVINQYEVSSEDGAKHDNRYDVTVLVNGLPMVHIELKRRGVPIREAFNQIERYQRDSFWAKSGLFEYIQVFVISNGTQTKYYSNTTRWNLTSKGSKKKISSSFDFTSYWADSKNRRIEDLVDFAKTFFCKSTILNILTKYCVLTVDDVLLVMRPYQIAASEKIIERININSLASVGSKTHLGGYIWHHTGSGKTLTSFKTAQLAARRPDIDKVLFVVDRNDLDYQTMKEYDRFEKGCASGNKSTAVLQRQLGDANAHIIITTIQKLACFIKKNPSHQIYDKNVVFIFDECHRSQFGSMHTAISKAFKKHLLFGFTGTPIFAENAKPGIDSMTTEMAFGSCLHHYTIAHAINDHNVLPFKVDFISTIATGVKEKGTADSEKYEKGEKDEKDEKVPGVSVQVTWESPQRIKSVVEYIITHFNRKTYRNAGRNYEYNVTTNVSGVLQGNAPTKRQSVLNGFNSILATSSTDAAQAYYREFKRQFKEFTDKELKIEMIYSYAPNEAENSVLTEEDADDTAALPVVARDALDEAIADYNKMFSTSYDTSAEKFPNYYKDVSQRMKNREIDLLIVVNMFLTGFDAPTVNTLWVDKSLKYHGLIQAFSRTNRILNSVKVAGNIVCFRPLQQDLDDAISLFGDTDTHSILLLRSFNDYYYGDKQKLRGYVDLVADLQKQFPLDQPITGEQSQKEFITLMGQFLKMRNILSSFDDFDDTKTILSERDMQDYLGRYQDLNDEWKEKREKGENVDVQDDVVFENELVSQIEVNVDYILRLVEQYRKTHMKDKDILVSINKAIDSSPGLRDKKELIEKFIAGLDESKNVYTAWDEFVEEERKKALAGLVDEEKVDADILNHFLEECVQRGYVPTDGLALDQLVPRTVGLFGGGRSVIKDRITEKIKKIFSIFYM